MGYGRACQPPSPISFCERKRHMHIYVDQPVSCFLGLKSLSSTPVLVERKTCMLYSTRCARRRTGKCKRVCRVSSAGRKFAACVLASHRFFCVCILFRSPSDRSRIVLRGGTGDCACTRASGRHLGRGEGRDVRVLLHRCERTTKRTKACELTYIWYGTYYVSVVLCWRRYVHYVSIPLSLLLLLLLQQLLWLFRPEWCVSSCVFRLACFVDRCAFRGIMRLAPSAKS